MRVQSFIKRRGGEKSGATALEFALIAPVFFTLIFAIIETACVYVAEAWLQYSVSDIGRQVRTGEIQLANTNETQFRNQVCARIAPFLACGGDLKIDVNAYNDFSNADISAPVDGAGNFDPSKLRYDPGDPCEVVLVRAFYTWTVITPVMSAFLVNFGSDKHMVSAAAAMRNEPYTTAVAGC